jgi:outer membrane protein assembly factor BamB
VLPASIAGNPIVVGKHAIVPLANGMLYRMNLTTDRPLEDGPTWRGDRVSTQTLCHLAAISEDEFLASDGARSLNRWRWSAEQDFSKRGGLTLAERIAAAPAVFMDGSGSRVFVIDIRNNATLWETERLTAMNPTPLRSWRTGEMGTLPSGTLTNGPFAERDANGKPRIAFVLDKVTVVWLDPGAPAPLWIVKSKEVGPAENIIGRPTVFSDRLYLTQRMGKCVSLDLDKGQPRDELARLRGSAVPAASVIALEGLLLVPLSDGTVLLHSNGPKPARKPPFILLPLPPLGAVVPLPLEP